MHGKMSIQLRLNSVAFALRPAYQRLAVSHHAPSHAPRGGGGGGWGGGGAAAADTFCDRDCTSTSPAPLPPPNAAATVPHHHKSTTCSGPRMLFGLCGPNPAGMQGTSGPAPVQLCSRKSGALLPTCLPPACGVLRQPANLLVGLTLHRR